MTPFEIVTAILNLLALILIPIVAVIIGQHLQNVSAKRKDKMDVFKTMMMNRIGWSVEGTRAMNIIDIVFSDDKNVRQAWSEYYLGYKDKITWETIQNPYIPKGMMEAMDQQQIIQKGQTELAKVAGAFAQIINANAANQAPNRLEDTSHANT